MEELKAKIKEYDSLFESLIERALNNDIEKDSNEWSKLDELKLEIQDLAFSL